MGKRILFTGIIAAIALLPVRPARSYDINLGPLGHACDTCGGGVLGGLPVVGHAINEAQAQATGAALEQWINASRNTAISGSMPIPPEVREQLTGYSSERSMNRARYKIGDNGFLNLAHVLEQGGYPTAVTLNDVIVFRGPTEANDLSVWAHELTHVDQYADWGVHSFAISYARDYGSVENPAYAKGNGFVSWRQSQLMSSPGSPQPLSAFASIPALPPLTQICRTNFNACVTPPAPVASPCACFSPAGLIPGVHTPN